MRLFYALTFENKTKRQISGYRDWLADHSLKGRFTREENFHITLAFLGNCGHNQLAELSELVHRLSDCPERVRACQLGSFKIKGRELVWLGIEREACLTQLQKDLNKKLSALGYPVEKRRFKPHITLGRDMVMRDNLRDLFIEPIDLRVAGIALMESKTVNEQLVYEALEEYKLRE